MGIFQEFGNPKCRVLHVQIRPVRFLHEEQIIKTWAYWLKIIYDKFSINIIFILINVDSELYKLAFRSVFRHPVWPVRDSGKHGRKTAYGYTFNTISPAQI